jgi:hypothetical protein
MKITRTWPSPDPEIKRGRNYIEDEFPRTYIKEYDNSSLIDYKDDLVVLEWDIAVSLEDLECFCEIAAQTPEQVMVAPYKLYPESDPQAIPANGAFAHRVVQNPVTLHARWITVADWYCDLFSFGMVYLPKDLISGFIQAQESSGLADKRMTDANFSAWHYRQVKQPVAINWAVKPIHLHYQTRSEYPWS